MKTYTMVLYVASIIISTIAGAIALYILSLIMGDEKLTIKGALIVSLILSIVRFLFSTIANQFGEGGKIIVQLIGIIVRMGVFVVKGGFQGIPAFFAAIIHGALSFFIRAATMTLIYPVLG